MRRFLAVWLCASLGACAMTPGLETDNRFAALDEKIASDTVAHLARLYPPARTQFNFTDSAGGSFGPMLIAKLRARGYAITDPAPPASRAALPADLFGAVFPSKPSEAKMDAEAAAPAKSAGGIELQFLLDHGRSAGFSRITLKIGNSLLARAYRVDEGRIAPAGAWTYKE